MPKHMTTAVLVSSCLNSFNQTRDRNGWWTNASNVGKHPPLGQRSESALCIGNARQFGDPMVPSHLLQKFNPRFTCRISQLNLKKPFNN